jgi:molecular chaperone GrpE
MENYRKRQRRLAEEQIAEERERLIRRFLQVADDLERALTEPHADTNSLRQGIHLTYRSLMQFLEQEGVEKVPAQGQPFDPQWHEAVGAMPQHEAGIQPNTVIEVLRPGYRIEGHLLRPARVVVSA